MIPYARPSTLTEALQHLAEVPATIAAGCTDLFPATDRPALAGPILDLTGIAGLDGIDHQEGAWRIGANATWTDLLRAELPPAFDMLKEAATEVGSIQIQNAGTVVGNICNASPAADGVPPLLALDAEIALASRNGTRQLALRDFLTGPRQTALAPGEIVTALHIPDTATTGRSRFLKLGARRYLVISIAMVAARLEVHNNHVTQAALAVGACGPVATRLPDLEAALANQPVDVLPDLITEASIAPALSPIDDIRATAAYRLTAAAELLRRAVRDLTGGQP